MNIARSVVMFTIISAFRCFAQNGGVNGDSSPSPAVELKLATATPTSTPPPLPKMSDLMDDAAKEAELRKTRPDNSSQFRRLLSFAIWRLEDYKAMMAKQSLDDTMKLRGTGYKPVATGLCKLGSDVNFDTTDSRYHFNIVGSRSPTDTNKVHLSYTFSIQRISPDNPSALYDRSVLYVHGDGDIGSAWQHNYVLFTRSNKPEHQYALTFHWWHSM